MKFPDFWTYQVIISSRKFHGADVCWLKEDEKKTTNDIIIKIKIVQTENKQDSIYRWIYETQKIKMREKKKKNWVKYFVEETRRNKIKIKFEYTTSDFVVVVVVCFVCFELISLVDLRSTRSFRWNHFYASLFNHHIFQVYFKLFLFFFFVFLALDRCRSQNHKTTSWSYSIFLLLFLFNNKVGEKWNRI